MYGDVALPLKPDRKTDLTQVAVDQFVLSVTGMDIGCGLNPTCVTAVALVVGVAVVVEVVPAVLTTSAVLREVSCVPRWCQ